MNFLLFFIAIFFSGVFYTFYKINLGQKVYLSGQEHFIGISSISGNLLIETIIFLVLAIVMFIYFSNFSFSQKDEEIGEEEEYYEEKESYLSRIDFSMFLKKHIYYIGFILFYCSVYLIFKSFGISEFNYFILILNIVIGILFFITNKAEIFRDFIKINTIIFSLFYIFFYLYFLFLASAEIALVDIINTLFILSFFIITAYSDAQILKRNGSDNALVLYFFLYMFVVCSYYIKELFSYPGKDFLHVIVLIGLLFNAVIYFFLQKLDFLQNSKYVLRTLSIIFMYISTLLGMIILIKNNEGIDFKTIIIYGILLYSVVFNFLIHKKFQNYVSYGVSLFAGFFILYFSAFNIALVLESSFLKWEIIITFFLSFSLIAFTYINNLQNREDYVFLHFCAYLVSLLGIVYYFYYADFVILDFGIVLLLGSILIFLSNFRLKQIQT